MGGVKGILSTTSPMTDISIMKSNLSRCLREIQGLIPNKQGRTAFYRRKHLAGPDLLIYCGICVVVSCYNWLGSQVIVKLS